MPHVRISSCCIRRHHPRKRPCTSTNALILTLARSSPLLPQALIKKDQLDDYWKITGSHSCIISDLRIRSFYPLDPIISLFFNRIPCIPTIHPLYHHHQYLCSCTIISYLFVFTLDAFARTHIINTTT
jgi:hypothetical protein